jgi:hypothetical protein
VQQEHHNEQVVITRQGTDLGKNDRTRVYVTGPFNYGGPTIYSSTLDRDEASRFDADEAERLLADGFWSDNEPRIEKAVA